MKFRMVSAVSIRSRAQTRSFSISLSLRSDQVKEHKSVSMSRVLGVGGAVNIDLGEHDTVEYDFEKKSNKDWAVSGSTFSRAMPGKGEIYATSAGFVMVAGDTMRNARHRS